MSRSRRLAEEIDFLDPETQYNEIMKLVADNTFTSMIVDLSVTVSTMQVTVAPHGSKTLVGTGKFLHRGDDRMRDSLKYILSWYFNGTDSDETRRSMEQLNRIHLGVAKRFPGAFSDNDDFIYTLCQVGTFGDRVREVLGLPPSAEKLKVARHHFLRDLSTHLVGEHGAVTRFPETYREMMDFVSEWESRDRPRTDTGRELAHSLTRQFATRNFPKPLRWYGRTLVRLFTPEQVRDIHRLGDPGRITGPVVKHTFRLLLFVSDHRPRRVPFSEKFALKWS